MKQFFGLILLTWPCLLVSQQFAATAIPDSLLSGADEVVREEYYELEARSEKAGVVRYRKVVTLLRSDSDANTFVLGYDSDSKVKKLEARIYDAAGQEVRKLDKDEIRDFAAVDGFSIYQDNRLKYLEANHHEYPYTLAYEYEMSAGGINFAFFPRWQIQQYRQSIEQSRFVIRLPKEIPLHYKALNTAVEPQLEEGGKAVSYTWNVQGLKAVEKEAFSPPASEVLPMLLTAAGKFRVEEHVGSMSNWQVFGAFIGRLFEGRDVLPAAVANEARQLVAGADSDMEKVEILYRYLQENMRYVSVQLGIGGWQPFDASYVAENKYGDCKALSNFMKALLQEAGIASYPVLIANGQVVYGVEEDFTYPLFNHAILYVPSENKWLECTSTTFPPGYIGSGNDGRNGLLITPEGGQLKTTPSLTEKDNTTYAKTEITLEEKGAAIVKAQIQATGSRHEVFRWRKAYNSQEELEKWFIDNSSLPALTLESLEIHAEPDVPLAHCHYQASLSRYASRACKRLFIPLNAVSPLGAVPEKMEERRQPIVLNTAYTEVDTVIFALPKGFQVESMPEEPVIVESSFGRYEAKVEKEENRLFYIRRLQLRQSRLPAKEYEDFRAFFQRVAKADKVMVVLVEKRA